MRDRAQVLEDRAAGLLSELARPNATFCPTSSRPCVTWVHLAESVQREEIEAWAKRRGARVLTVFEEFDESGCRTDRPLLQEAIRAALSRSSFESERAPAA